MAESFYDILKRYSAGQASNPLEAKRTLPNNGGSYNVVTEANPTTSTPMNIPNVTQETPGYQTPQMSAGLQTGGNNLTTEEANKLRGVMPPVQAPAPAAQPAKAPMTDEEVVKLNNSIANKLQGKPGFYDNQTQGGYQSGDYVSDIFRLQGSQAMDALRGEGMYKMPEGVVLSPDQQRAIRNSADDVYAERLAALGYGANMQNKMIGSGMYGMDLSGLTPEASGLVNAGLVGGGTEAERNRAIRQLSQMSPEQQKSYANSMVYQKLSVGERDSRNQAQTAVDGTRAVINMTPEDLNTNPAKYQATRFSEYLGGERSPQYQNFISMVGNIKAPIINKTYGAAVTGSEYARALEWLPGLESQSMGTVMTNLRNLAAFNEYAIDAQNAMYLGMPKPSLESYLNKWQGMSKGSISGEQSFDIDSFIQTATQNGYSQEQVKEFLKSKGINFNNVGGGTNKAISSVDEAMQRIANVESRGSGDYNAVGPVVTSGQYKGEQALGKYQIMPGNIPQWSKEALGYSVTPQQFMASPEIQDAIAKSRMTKIYQKYGNWDDVASVWFTGRPASEGRLAQDVTGTTGADYVRKFNL